MDYSDIMMATQILIGDYSPGSNAFGSSDYAASIQWAQEEACRLMGLSYIEDLVPWSGVTGPTGEVVSTATVPGANIHINRVLLSDGVTPVVPTPPVAGPFYYLTTRKAIGASSQAIYLLNNTASIPYVSVYNGATGVESPYGPALPTGPGTTDAAGYVWQDIGIDSTGTIHVGGMGKTPGANGQLAYYDFILAPSSTAWVQNPAYGVVSYSSYWGPGFSNTVAAQELIFPNGNAIVNDQVYNVSNSGYPSNTLMTLNPPGNTYLSGIYTGNPGLRPCDASGYYYVWFSGLTGTIELGNSTNANYSALTLSGLPNGSGVTNAQATIVCLNSNSTAYLVFTDNQGKTHILQSSTLYNFLYYTDLGQFSYTLLSPQTLPPAVAPSKALIYLSAQTADGANAVWWNGTTFVEDLISMGGTLYYGALPMISIDGATFQRQGRAQYLSDGGIIHSINSGYFN